MAAARIKLGLQSELYLGNLDAVRDWGYAPEYVEGMWRMLQSDKADDFVLATGTAVSVRDFLVYSFGELGLNWEDHVRFDERYVRPTEVDSLIGDASKAKAELNWEAQTTAKELAKLMVTADLERIESRSLDWIDKPRFF
jgi:GDPmannose 4,6-dehydratase